ncbi:MAG: sodium:proton antiporter [Planctomycetota bacterium]
MGFITFEGAAPPVPLWTAAPFVLLLLLIATGPLLFKHFWHHHYPKISLALGALVAFYYIAFRNEGGHGVHKVTHAGIEYFAFVALIGSLFVVASTILLKINSAGTTAANATLLGFASVLANLVGTTGASMLLLRPYLRMNRGHFASHHLVFFIFIVANVGGALTPIGDPPLFLGYLKGIPFFWTAENLALEWMVTNGALLLLFVIFDRIHDRRSRREITKVERFGLEITGLRSFVFLFAILGLVFVQNEPMVKSHQPVSTVVVAALMILLAAIAFVAANKDILRANEFTFDPIKEVAFLFAGIFLTMIPALEYLEQNATALGIESPLQFYFATGILSAFLDNAPTYLTFLTTECAVNNVSFDDTKGFIEHLQSAKGSLNIQAISCGAVFFGAMTYIGNGPNFMVKSITEAAGHKCPSFFGYLLKWAVPVLLPVLVLVGIVFYYL